MELQARYKVTFKLKGKERIIFFQGQCSLDDIRDGFWVCEDLDITVVSKSRYYVLPHQIILIEKL